MKIQLKVHNRITLPQEALDEVGVNTGDDFLYEVGDGSLPLIPAMTIPLDEAYLFTPEWQDRIRKAEDDLRTGRIHKAPTAKDMIKQLNEA